MQIGQLEQYGVPVWNVSPLAKNLLVKTTPYPNTRILGNGNLDPECKPTLESPENIKL